MSAGSQPDSQGAQSVLQVRDLEVHYGPLTALQATSFDVAAGEIVVLLGANGAGKSSLLKAIMGLEPIAAGTASFDGRDLGRLPSHRRARLGIGYVPEGRGVFPTMSVEENIFVGLRKDGAREKVLSTVFELFPVLSERRRQVAGSMSGGEQQMLALARALAGEPRLLLIDELSLGLAPKIVARLFEKVAQLRDSGISILLVEQFAHAALRVADRSGVFVRGEMTAFGAAAELAALTPAQLTEMYFGTRGSNVANGSEAAANSTTEVQQQ